MKPSDDASALVQVWLRDNDIDPAEAHFSTARDWITLTIPIHQAESLLDTKYHVYQHLDGDKLVRTTSWSLPRSLHPHVATVQPTTAFLRTKKNAAVTPTMDVDIDLVALAAAANMTELNRACNFRSMTPNCLRLLYNIAPYVPKLPNQNLIGFTNYLEEVWNGTDLERYMATFRPDIWPQRTELRQVGINQGPFADGVHPTGMEANLDIQIIAGITSPTTIVSYSTGGRPNDFIPDLHTPTNTNEPYLEWVQHVLEQDPSIRPSVISTSYGDTEQSVPRSYAEAVCNQFTALTAQGITLIFPSGDFGVGANGTCVTNDGQNAERFTPLFPASCPYVTTVGGTQSYPEVIAADPRTDYVSGAGFSDYFARPAYQDQVVQDYVRGMGNDYEGLYNSSGRAYPDISAYGIYFTIWINGSVASVGGTSASAPTIASIFSLVNDALVSSGRPTMGFLNPWLYSEGHKAFTDVVNGTTTGCDGPGFRAGPGWDAGSGFGTPDFGKILEILDL